MDWITKKRLARQNYKAKTHGGDQFLGMEVKQSEDGHITLGQTAFAERIVSRYNMTDAFPVSTPFALNRIVSSSAPPNILAFPYRSAVGSLNYLAVATRPDISFAVGVAGRSLENPGSKEVAEVKRIIRYVNGSAGLELNFPGEALVVDGYCDADYAGDVITR